MSTIITHEQLKTATGFDSNASIEKCLRQQHVAVLYGKNGRVFTTIDALNAAMGLKSMNPEPESIEFIR